MLTKLKRRVQEWFTAEAKILCNIGFTPNKISILGLFLAFSSALIYTFWKFDPPLMLITASLLLLASGFCDAIDGIIARIYGKVTVFGSFLDSVADRYADAVTIAGIIFGGLCDPLWGFFAIVGSLLVSYTRAKAELAGVKMESVGLMERAERIIIIAFSTLIEILVRNAIWWAIVLLAILTNLTVLQRMRYFYLKTMNK